MGLFLMDHHKRQVGYPSQLQAQGYGQQQTGYNPHVGQGYAQRQGEDPAGAYPQQNRAPATRPLAGARESTGHLGTDLL